MGNRPEAGNSDKKSLNLQLWEASRRGVTSKLAALVESGAQLNAAFETSDKSRSTALHFATVAGHVDTVQELVRLGADLRAVDDEECTALHLAATRGDMRMVEALLRLGADVRIGNMWLRTAGQLAGDKGHVDVAERLEREEEEANFIHQSMEMDWRSESVSELPLGRETRELLAFAKATPPGSSTTAEDTSSLLFTGSEHHVDSSEVRERRRERRLREVKALKREVADDSTSTSALFDQPKRFKKSAFYYDPRHPYATPQPNPALADTAAHTHERDHTPGRETAEL